jgi:16S rRNA processing protein RimM
VPDQANHEFVTIARLVRARGNKGELVAELESDDPGLLSGLPEVQLWDGATRRLPGRVMEAWPHKGRVVVKLEGVDTIERAEGLAGWEIQIPLAQRSPAPQGRFYISDLVGCSVVDRRSNRLIGEVTGIMETGGTPLLEVKGPEREILVPFATAICVEVDAAGRLIRADLPEGLEEL